MLLLLLLHGYWAAGSTETGVGATEVVVGTVRSIQLTQHRIQSVHLLEIIRHSHWFDPVLLQYDENSRFPIYIVFQISPCVEHGMKVFNDRIPRIL